MTVLAADVCSDSMNQVIAQLGCTRSEADPFLYYKWTDEGPIMCLSWVDDCFITGPEGAALKLKMDMMTTVDCDDGGELKECVGCQIDQDREARKEQTRNDLCNK
jgi:hypothetical protein